MAASLIDNLRKHGVSLLTEQDGEFRPMLQSFTFIHEDKIPSIVALPSTDEQVAAVVAECVAAKQEMIVRGRGHDSFGRFTKQGSVCIDLRNLSSVVVSDDKKTATVGAGTSTLKVLEELAPYGLNAASGGCEDVAFCSFSMIGGYGLYSSLYGMGTDQIVGARMVNAEGKLIDADERLLKGLRGGGGLFGVVVSLTVKVYPLEEIQAGLLMFDNSDLVKTITDVLSGLEALSKNAIPRELVTVPLITNIPGLGVTPGVLCVWAGPACETQRQWIGKVASLAPAMPGVPGIPEAIMSTKPHELLKQLSSRVPKQVKGNVHGASFSHFSEETIAALAKHAAAQPAGGSGGFIVLIISKESPSCSDEAPEAVSPYRKPHVMVEILGVSPDEEIAERMKEWATNARKEVGALDAFLESSYVPLAGPEFFDVRKIYGDNYAELERIKKQYDPNNVFCNTHPRLAE